jgi:hypothetical protein
MADRNQKGETMFSKKKLITFAIAAAIVSTVTLARAQDSGALLDLLVRKHIITDQEAEEVRAELTKEAASTSAGKLKLSTPITEFEIYGDARVRYEVRTGEVGPPNTVDMPGDNSQRNRSRYRLRLGIRGVLLDDWFFGVRLETSQNPRSTNVTFGGDSSSGPFAKNDDGINVGQAYFGYKGFKDVALTVGRMPNPFVTTTMTWDPDINPEGIAEQWKHTFKMSLGSGESAASVASTSKEGKSVVTTTPSEPRTITIDLFANFAQFVYDDENPENAVGPAPSGVPQTDAYMLGWQIGAKVNFTKTIYLQLAPTIYNYTGDGDTFNKHFSGDPDFIDPINGRTSRNQTGINSLLVFDMPAEFGWTFGELPLRIFGDFAVNFDADERAAAAGHPDKGDDRYAYQIGFGVGKLKAKHDWQVDLFWQHVDQFAVDPNLVDSDLFDSRVNMEGIAVRLGYAVTDAITANLTYGYAWQIDDDLGTGGVGDTFTLNPLAKYHIFQADLSVKF